MAVVLQCGLCNVDMIFNNGSANELEDVTKEFKVVVIESKISLVDSKLI